MKARRVSNLQVSWVKSAAPQNGVVTLRLLSPGAQAIPTEHTLDASNPDRKVTFYLTPLAKGALPGHKLLVLSGGRKIQEIPLSSKVVSQRLTWLLLACTFLVPWFIVTQVRPLALGEKQADGRIKYQLAKNVEKNIRSNVPEPPAFLENTFVEGWLVHAPSVAAGGYEHVVGLTGVLPIAYYAGLMFLVLTLLSAFFLKPKRLTITGKPFP